MKIFITISLPVFFFNTLSAQDLIIFRSGDEIESKVTEILESTVKYRKFNNLSGSLYTAEKADLFMIKFENGTKEVFNNANASSAVSSSSGTSTFYFYRPKKLASSRAKIIIGTTEPDEVVLKLKNGSWFNPENSSRGG